MCQPKLHLATRIADIGANEGGVKRAPYSAIWITIIGTVVGDCQTRQRNPVVLLSNLRTLPRRNSG